MSSSGATAASSAGCGDSAGGGAWSAASGQARGSLGRRGFRVARRSRACAAGGRVPGCAVRAGVSAPRCRARASRSATATLPLRIGLAGPASATPSSRRDQPQAGRSWPPPAARQAADCSLTALAASPRADVGDIRRTSGTRRIAPARSWLMLPLKASGFARNSAEHQCAASPGGRRPTAIPAISYSVSPRSTRCVRRAVGRDGAAGRRRDRRGGGRRGRRRRPCRRRSAAALRRHRGRRRNRLSGAGSPTEPPAPADRAGRCIRAASRPRAQLTSTRKETKGSLIASRERTSRTLRPS